ncbi:MAG: RNA 3'-terminal phosphate cyclase [Fimbriimonadaceae bacterium]|nr:RNA 3'-terminal phosphate cyclase [Fimbriimonadaceae bacterium]
MRAATSHLTIDGSYGEGGGALLRTALVMSAMTVQPVRISNVRANGRYAGLDAEDLTLLRGIAELASGEMEGDQLGSHELIFVPKRRPRGMSGTIRTVRNSGGRGANALITATWMLPVLARSGMYGDVMFEGETYGLNALSYDAFAHGTLGVLREFGLYAYPTLQYAGFGREANGKVRVEVEPSAMSGLRWLDRGGMRSVEAYIVAHGLPSSVAERAETHLSQLARSQGIPLVTHVEPIDADGPGVFITLVARYERGLGTGTSLGTKGLRVEAVATQAWDQLTTWMRTDATVDPYLADQVLLPAIFADGETVFRVNELTSRLLTQIWVIKQFGPVRILVKGNEGGPGTVQIHSEAA